MIDPCLINGASAFGKITKQGINPKGLCILLLSARDTENRIQRLNYKLNGFQVRELRMKLLSQVSGYFYGQGEQSWSAFVTQFYLFQLKAI